MTDILPFLKSLLSVSGLSGFEPPAAKIISAEWKPLVDEISFSKLGSLHGLKRGSAKGKRPSILIATHMDAIGMIVTRIHEGFIYFTEIGGVDPRVLPGTPVTVFGVKELRGVVAIPVGQGVPPEYGMNPVPLENLIVDVGLPLAQVKKLVRVGDVIAYATTPTELSGDFISGHSLDNRASVAALTLALEALQNKIHTWDVWAVASSQEEITLGGAETSAFGLQPDIVVAIDVTFGKGPGASDYSTHSMGKGVALGFGPNVHTFIYKKFKALAEKLEIPFATDVMPRHSGTDAYSMQVVRQGIPSMVLSIPLRYMHTPVEVVSVKDIQRTGRLLAEFIASLELDFKDSITWDD